jgi:hypothetical protein
MRKLFSWFLIFLGLFVLFISTSKDAMKSISDRRNNDVGLFGTYHGVGGDLGSISYLGKVPKFSKHDPFTYKRPPDTTDKNIDLYVFGDSYVVFIPDSAYAHIAHFHSGRRDYTNLYYKLDPNKRNILIFENAERFARFWLRHTFAYGAIMPDTTGKPISLRLPTAQVTSAAFMDIPLEKLFNPNINPNLEYNLFNYNLINPVRELKAMLNYKFFRRGSGDVVISEDGNELFLKQTVAETGFMSSYEKLNPHLLDSLTDTIGAMYQHYKKQGFDEVYLSIPPNPASILQPKYYNGFIPLLKKKLDSAGIPYIDDYDLFIKSPDKGSLFFPDDTHWNSNGEEIWINTVNEILTKESRKAKAR